MYSKIFLLALFACVTLARPQEDLDTFNEELLDRLGPVNTNPQYNYAYQIADDESQNYMAHNEARDGDEVTGTYSYVDANGALVTVEYIANENGYQETRTLQENFITLNDNRNGYTQPEIIKTTPKPRPVTPRPTRAPRPPPTTAAPSDDDLVARIIAQLTPFIKTTVSNSLQANQNAAPAPARAPAPKPAPVRKPAPAPAPVLPPAVVRQDDSVEGVFGVVGENNVRVTSPEFSFAYDLRK